MLENVFKERPDAGASAVSSGAPARRSSVPAALLLPFLLLLLLGLIVYLFGWLSFDRRDAMELVEEVRAAQGERRALAAYELSRLEAYSLEGASRRRFLSVAEGLLAEPGGRDPRVSRSLAITLGRLGERSSVAALLEAAGDPDPETQIYSLWALGAIGDPRALGSLSDHLASDDPAVRKTAAFALGQLGDPAGAGPLGRALNDPVADVTWNAAVALARLRDEACLPILLPILSGDVSRGDLPPQQIEDLRINAMRAARNLMVDSVRAALKRVASTDASARIRAEAHLALKGQSPPPFHPVVDVASPR